MLIGKAFKFYCGMCMRKIPKLKAFAELKDNLLYGKQISIKIIAMCIKIKFNMYIGKMHNLQCTRLWFVIRRAVPQMLLVMYVVISDNSNHDKYTEIVFNNLILESFLENHLRGSKCKE